MVAITFSLFCLNPWPHNGSMRSRGSSCRTSPPAGLPRRRRWGRKGVRNRCCVSWDVLGDEACFPAPIDMRSGPTKSHPRKDSRDSRRAAAGNSASVCGKSTSSTQLAICQQPRLGSLDSFLQNPFEGRTILRLLEDCHVRIGAVENMIIQPAISRSFWSSHSNKLSRPRQLVNIGSWHLVFSGTFSSPAVGPSGKGLQHGVMILREYENIVPGCHL